MQIGDTIMHKKNKHWGTGKIESFSKSGKMIVIKWKGLGGMYGSWRNYCKVESIELVTSQR